MFLLNFLTTILFGMPGGTELILIIVVVLLLFGGKKIPELMKGIGRGMKEFKNAKESEGEEVTPQSKIFPNP